MLAPHHRAALKRAVDVAIVAAFLALSLVVYGVFLLDAANTLTSPAPAEFSDFYRPGQNPWTGAIEPTTPEERLANTTPRRHAFR